MIKADATIVNSVVEVRHDIEGSGDGDWAPSRDRGGTGPGCGAEDDGGAGARDDVSRKHERNGHDGGGGDDGWAIPAIQPAALHGPGHPDPPPVAGGSPPGRPGP